MKISLSIWSTHKYLYDGKWSSVDFIDFVGTTKAQGVELLSVFWRDKEREIPQIREALKRNNLELACFGACNNLALLDASKRREQIKDITDSVDDAVRFGANVVRVFSGDKSEETTFEQAKAWIIEGLKEASVYAESQGVTLCLENHGYFAGKADQVIAVIEEVGSNALKSTFDTGNFLLVDEDPNDAIGKLKALIAHVHFKDFSKVGEDYEGHVYKSLKGERYAGQVPGEGVVDLKRILGELKQAGYNEWLTVEYEGDEEQLQGSVQSIENLERILSEF